MEGRSLDEVYNEVITGVAQREGGLELFGLRGEWAVRQKEAALLFEGVLRGYTSGNYGFGDGASGGDPIYGPAAYKPEVFLRDLGKQGVSYFKGEENGLIGDDLSRSSHDRRIDQAPMTFIEKTGPNGAFRNYNLRSDLGKFSLRDVALAIPETGLELIGLFGKSNEVNMAVMRIIKEVLSGNVPKFRSSDSALTESYLENQASEATVPDRIKNRRRSGASNPFAARLHKGSFIVTSPENGTFRTIPFSHSEATPLLETLTLVEEAALSVRRDFFSF